MEPAPPRGGGGGGGLFVAMSDRLEEVIPSSTFVVVELPDRVRLQSGYRCVQLQEEIPLVPS